MSNTLRSVAWSLAGILVSGVAGATAGWGLIAALGLTGVPGALLATVIAMLVATGVFVLITVALRKLGFVR